MATIQPRKLSEKEVVLSYKDGPLVEQIVDGETKMVPEKIQATTVVMRELTANEAMDAEDFAVVESKTGMPSSNRQWKTYGIFSVVKITDKHAPNGESVSPKSGKSDYDIFVSRISNNELTALGVHYRMFCAELEKSHDPKDSPSDQ